jgi:chemotaxis protein CheD
VELEYLRCEDGAVIVGVGELGLAEYPHVLVTQALGSCVGLALWDSMRRAGGMAHVMLPELGDSARGDGNIHRFASQAVPTLIDKLADAGSPKRRLVAKLAGGAAMFGGDSGLPRIGDRNVAEVKQQLANAGIPVRGEDTGGSHARTIELHLDTGILLVRSYVYGVREI